MGQQGWRLHCRCRISGPCPKEIQLLPWQLPLQLPPLQRPGLRAALQPPRPRPNIALARHACSCIPSLNRQAAIQMSQMSASQLKNYAELQLTGGHVFNNIRGQMCGEAASQQHENPCRIELEAAPDCTKTDVSESSSCSKAQAMYAEA